MSSSQLNVSGVVMSGSGSSAGSGVVVAATAAAAANSGSGDSSGSSQQQQQQTQTTTQQQQQQQQAKSTTTATSTAPHIVGASTTDIATTTTTTNTTTTTSLLATDSSPRESGDDSEDESEILEESPCGRWLKRREELEYRDVPGIDCVHLAMDTEEGVEVVWNEVQYASLQELKSQEDKMRQVFDNLLQLDHPNIVKFHKYWTDTQNADRPRVIFITEHMSSGSLKQFLKRTKRNAKRLPLEAWRRWCTQILSALSYLHSCIPPVIHGNLTCDSIFIQHNGLVKIDSVVPDAVHYSVRQPQTPPPTPSSTTTATAATTQSSSKAESIEHDDSHHFRAPEYGAARQLTAAVDIFAFGMCALEMAALEITTPGREEPSPVDHETISRTLQSLESELQDLITKCLRLNPAERPSASDLLFHPLLFEVHSLKLLAAHCLVFSPKNRTMYSETVIDAMMQRFNRPEVVMAKLMQNGEEKYYSLADVPSADKLEKFVEDVKNGVYPLTAYSGKKPPHFRSRAASPERNDAVKSPSPEPVDIETRRIVNMMCSVKKIKEDSDEISMTILLRMDDKMNRQLTCQVSEDDTAADLTDELVRLGFVHIDDQEKIQALLEETLRGSFAAGALTFEHGTGQPLTFSATINEHPSMGSGTSSMGAAVAAGLTGSITTIPNDKRNWSVSEMESTSAALRSKKQQQQSQMPQTYAAVASHALVMDDSAAEQQLQAKATSQADQLDGAIAAAATNEAANTSATTTTATIN